MASVALEGGGYCPYFRLVGGHVPLVPPASATYVCYE
jgi:hypothetical protein